VNRRTLGILATIVGSALSAWWITMQRREGLRSAGLQPGGDRGTVMFDNTPTASNTDIEGII